ncbi:MAG TPA: hypothetical protein VKE74_35600 [Gemmataceae bacterium]|nr:hypothetical protein [Gemmataceae bacterium]
MTRPVALLLALGLLFALAGCKKDTPAGDKDKKADNTGPGPGSGPGPTVGPPEKVKPDHPAQAAAAGLVKDLRAGTGIDPARVSNRFLKMIGKPLTPLSEDQTKRYNAGSADVWLKRAGLLLGDANVGLPDGHLQPGVAVFTGSFVSPRAAKGHYLLRLVEEGGAWKLDWFLASTVPADAPPAPANADDPFKDFTVHAAADLVSETIIDKGDRAPLAAALFSKPLLTSLDASLEKEDADGYDYKRGWLGAKLDDPDKFVGKKVMSYSYTRSGPDTYRVEFALEGGAKKVFEVKLVKGEGPGVWLINEFKPLPST